MHALRHLALRELAGRCVAVDVAALSLAAPVTFTARHRHSQAPQPAHLPAAQPGAGHARAEGQPRHSRGPTQRASGGSPAEANTERILEAYLRLRKQGKHLNSEEEELLTAALARSAEALHQKNVGEHGDGASSSDESDLENAEFVPRRRPRRPRPVAMPIESAAAAPLAAMRPIHEAQWPYVAALSARREPAASALPLQSGSAPSKLVPGAQTPSARQDTDLASNDSRLEALQELSTTAGTEVASLGAADVAALRRAALAAPAAPAEEANTQHEAAQARSEVPASEDFRDAGAVRAWFRKRQRRAPDHEAREAELAALSSQATLLTSALPAQQGWQAHVPSFLTDTDDAAPPASSAPLHQDAFDARPLAGATQGAPEQRLLRIGFVGIPNAGKSTLTNCLVGGTVSAVSIRPETTRRAALGAFVDGSTQVVIYDTPGMHGARDFATRSHAMRVASTWLHIQECDVYALLVDADKQLGRYASGHVDSLARALGSPRGPPGFEGAWRRRPVVLLLNKLDAVPRSRHAEVLSVAKHLGRLCAFQRAFALSARDGLGIAPLREHLLAAARPAPWELPAGCPTDLTWQELAAELVREKLYWAHNNEVPYKLAPVCTSFRVHAGGAALVEVDVPVATQRLKGLVQGQGRERAAKVERRVGSELAHMLRKHVTLSLRVRVRKNATLPLLTQ